MFRSVISRKRDKLIVVGETVLLSWTILLRVLFYGSSYTTGYSTADVYNDVCCTGEGSQNRVVKKNPAKVSPGITIYFLRIVINVLRRLDIYCV